jgi:ADP-ribosylglycohydrolase
MALGATVDGVLATAAGIARDGTRAAIDACLGAVDPGTDWREAIPLLRKAVTPYDSVGETYREPAQDSRRPSRLRSIEELPVALGLLKATRGDARGTILGATNYGRDSDSIATMGGALAGALGGEAAIPAEWADTVGTSSRLDLRAGGRTMAAVAAEIFAADEAAWHQRYEAFGGLLGDRPEA